jgi:hypothetical protein
VLAKLFELFDEGLLALGNLMSGHSLKHLAAAGAGLVVCRMLVLRVPIGAVSRGGGGGAPA